MCPYEGCGGAGRWLGQVPEDGTESLVVCSDMKMCYGVLNERRGSPISL